MNLISTIAILIYRKDINDRQDYLVVIFTPNSKRNDQRILKSTLFRALSMEWIRDRKAIIKETTYLHDLSIFEKDPFPTLGNLRIDQIKGKDAHLSVLKKLKNVTHEK